MNAKTKMQQRIMGRRSGGNIYRYTLPAEDPENTTGWTPAEKLLFITLRQTSNELGTPVFEISEDELAARMDRVLSAATTALATGTAN